MTSGSPSTAQLAIQALTSPNQLAFDTRAVSYERWGVWGFDERDPPDDARAFECCRVSSHVAKHIAQTRGHR